MRESVLFSAFTIGAIALGCGPDPTTLGNGAGSSGGAPSSSSRATNARGEFELTVYPSLEPSCASCHAIGTKGAPVFFGADAATSYGAIDAAGLVTEPWSSELLLHGTHTGPALSDTQNTIVTKWLRDEIALRGGDFGGSPALVAALKEIAGCMSYDAWKAAGLDKLAQTPTKNDGVCSGCHNAGDGNFLASTDDAFTFTRSKTTPFVFRWFIGTVDANGNLDGMTASSAIANKSVSALACGGAADCHPQFTLPAAVEQGIRDFTSATLASYRARSCASATSPPTDAGLADH